ncbi:unnamed protein product [Rangifer tarandus platyrhynchus]|uniref:Uncharacterized protein n=1 Tax=Rangifer tarandus platyrhynchus TaxID=3082113 RepID=A0ABN8Y354_RANTA|nr:unnamed protein product [Rangifer tarandus platyrhynchus]
MSRSRAPNVEKRGKLNPVRVNYSVRESEVEIPQTQTPFLTAASRSLMSCVSVAEDTRPWCFLAETGEAGITGVPDPCLIQQGQGVTETAATLQKHSYERGSEGCSFPRAGPGTASELADGSLGTWFGNHYLAAGPPALPTSALQTLPPRRLGRSETRAAPILSPRPPQPGSRADIRSCSPPGSDATPTAQLCRAPGAPGRGARIAHRGRAGTRLAAHRPQRAAPVPLTCAAALAGPPRASPAPGSDPSPSAERARGGPALVWPRREGRGGCGSSPPRATWGAREGAGQGRDRWAPPAAGSPGRGLLGDPPRGGRGARAAA